MSNLPNNTTPEVQATPAPTKKGCAVEGCKDRVVKILGFCRFCEKNHCQKHRLTESHSCVNINSCRDEHFARNEQKLMNEKTTASKMMM